MIERDDVMAKIVMGSAESSKWMRLGMGQFMNNRTPQGSKTAAGCIKAMATGINLTRRTIHG